jgi:hypothetical protein
MLRDHARAGLELALRADIQRNPILQEFSVIKNLRCLSGNRISPFHFGSENILLMAKISFERSWLGP